VPRSMRAVEDSLNRPPLERGGIYGVIFRTSNSASRFSRFSRPYRLNQASVFGAEVRMNNAGYRATRKTSSMVVSPMNAFASPS
jgi:hypothetical protein